MTYDNIIIPQASSACSFYDSELMAYKQGKQFLITRRSNFHALDIYKKGITCKGIFLSSDSIHFN